jgi:DNA-directed RNA polymerase specialized sigma24 family protein
VSSTDELFAALSRLRDAARGGTRELRSERADWRTVDAWLRRHRIARSEGGDDLLQEALLAVARRVGGLEARDGSSAAAWLVRVLRHKQIDAARIRASQRVEPLEDDALAATTHDAPPLDDDALDRIVAIVEDAIAMHVSTLELAPADALLRRLQARATLQRALGATGPEIRHALAIDDAVRDDRLHKWVERGRPILVAALARIGAEPGSVLASAIEQLRDVALERRIDAGIARPARRKSTAEEPT